ncbi:sigma factor-like helix-turn-helix DNA-binding protein [Kitasatospora sp. NPDC097643]|uniref:sigma factor-like helix-turn-helix DNA-binding protein n=1 Tax=Kitasatospora sp. NPDC097643 TaxID=3157230 RepID=UPI0033303E0F
MTTPPTAHTPTPNRRTRKDTARLLAKLTPREAQALAHLAAGHDLPQTAAALGITPATARGHVQRAMRKLGVTTAAEAIALTSSPPATAGPGGERKRKAGSPADPGRSRAPGGDTRQPPANPRRNPGPAAPADHEPAHPRSGAARTGGHHPAADPAGHDPVNGRSRRAPGDGRQTGPTTTPTTSAPAGARHAADSTDSTDSADDERDTPAGHRPTDPRSSTGPAAPADQPPAHLRGSGASPGDDRQDAAAGHPALGPHSAQEQRPAGAHGNADPADGTRDAAAGRRPTGPRRAEDQRSAHGSPAPGGGSQQLAPGRRPAGPRRSQEQHEGPRAAPAAAGAGAGGQGFEGVYEGAYVRLVQQAFLLTACRHRAVHCVARAFGEAARDWEEVAGAGDPEGWVRVRAFELALSPWHRGGPRRAHAWRLPHRRIRVRPADESQAVLPDHDRLTDRDRALLKALKRLSRPQRRALVLHDGLGLPAAAVAVEVESTLAAAEGRVWTARAALAQWVPDLVGADPAAPGFADRLSGLLHRAAVRGCPEPHRPAVPVLRARHGLVRAGRTGAAALLTVAVGGAALATLAGVRPAVWFRPPEPPAPSLCVPVTAADEPGVPVAPDGPPVGISSLWCSRTPGVEPVVLEPQQRAVALWELPQTAPRGGADAPPPRGPAAGPPVCSPWSPLPCTTGPTRP